MTDRFIRKAELEAKVGLCERQIRTLEGEGLFPARIQITPNGRFLYAPNRGHNSIAGFSVDPSSGTLSAAGHAATQAVPRAFSLDPQGKFVYAAGLETGNLTSYVIDQATGELRPSDIYPVGNRPMWVLITELGG